jgi:predicted nucleotidyltransferase
VNWQEALTAIITKLETISSVEGAFISGSLVNEHRDLFSDIDLGIATKNSPTAFDEIFALRHWLITVVGQPIHFLERGWGHCKMIAALFGKSHFPPIGLEIDIIFSQLRYVSEQMPYSEYRIVFDRNGKLQSALTKVSQSKPGQEVEKEIAQQLKWFPFYVHEAEMRKLIYFAAATRQGDQIYGSKRAYRYLSMAERQKLEESYRRSDESMVAQLAQLYLGCVTELQASYRIADNVRNFQTTLWELL